MARSDCSESDVAQVAQVSARSGARNFFAWLAENGNRDAPRGCVLLNACSAHERASESCAVKFVSIFVYSSLQRVDGAGKIYPG